MNNQITGVEQEVEFWRGFVKTDRFLNGWVAPIKTPELNQEVADFIKDHIPMHGNILDCGSGVVSILNGLMPGNYRLVATDLLAIEYKELFDYKKHGLKAPMAICMEGIEFENQFDIVHCSNALDHSQDPKLAFDNLYKAAKPGGYVILQGFENEANYEKWFGMHQWNIHLELGTQTVPEKPALMRGESLVIEGKNKANSFAINNPVFANTVTFENNKSWFIFIIKKQ